MRVATFLLVSIGVITQAHADDADVCIAASERAQQLRDDQRLLDARRELLACGRDTCPAPVRKDCAELLADIDRRTPSIVVRVRGPNGEDAVGAALSIDGHAIATRLDLAPIPLDPGVHTIRIVLDAAGTSERRIVLVQGEHERLVRIDLGAPGTVVGTRGGGQRVAGLVIGGVGLVGVALGAVFGGIAIADKDTQIASCSSTVSCPNQAGAISAHSDAVTAGAVSTVAFIAGGVLLASGIVVFFTAPRAKVSVGVTGLGVALHATF